MYLVSFVLFLVFVPMCFFTSFFYNKKDKFFKRFFKSFLYALCIGTISLFFYALLCFVECYMQDRFGYFSFPVKLFRILSNVSLYFLAIFYNLAVLIAIKFDKD